MTDQPPERELAHPRVGATNGAAKHQDAALRAWALSEPQPAEEPRDRLAGERDEEAQARDELATQRDADAALRDQEALHVDERDALFDRHTLRVEELRARAAAGRRRAADDRGRAARDRQLAAGDREQAAQDREQAARAREQAARERALAGIDELTGARRRGVGLEEAQREIERARRNNRCLVAAFVDVNDLKSVNDEQGHAAGDQLLRDVAIGLASRMRSYDLVIRIGGDEFLCVLPDVAPSEARRRFEGLVSALHEGPALRSVSFGLSELGDGDSLQNLIDRADSDLMLAGSRQRPRSSRRLIRAGLAASSGPRA